MKRVRVLVHKMPVPLILGQAFFLKMDFAYFWFFEKVVVGELVLARKYKLTQ